MVISPDIPPYVYPLLDDGAENTTCDSGGTPVFLGNYRVLGGRSPVSVRVIDERAYHIDMADGDGRTFGLFHLKGCGTRVAVEAIDAGQGQRATGTSTIAYEKVSSEE